MPKYYLTFSANRKLVAGAFTFEFDPIEQFAGNWMGVLKVEDKAQIKALAPIAKDLGLSELTEADYEKELKKKASWTKSSASSSTHPSPSSPISPNAKAVIKIPTARPIVEDVRPSSHDAIQVGKAPYLDPITKTVPPRQHYAKGWGA